MTVSLQRRRLDRSFCCAFRFSSRLALPVALLFGEHCSLYLRFFLFGGHASQRADFFPIFGGQASGLPNLFRLGRSLALRYGCSRLHHTCGNHFFVQSRFASKSRTNLPSSFNTPSKRLASSGETKSLTGSTMSEVMRVTCSTSSTVKPTRCSPI